MMIETHLFMKNTEYWLQYMYMTTRCQLLLLILCWEKFIRFQDGVIDFREFMSKVHIMSSGSPEENLRQLFRILDIDNNRTVSISEFKKVVTDLQMMSDNNMDNSILDLVVEKAFIEMDVNGDGMVTSEEFIKACLSQKKFSTMLILKLINVFLE